MPTASDPYAATNTLVQDYRRFLEKSGKRDVRTDFELTLELGRMLKAKNDGSFEAKAQQHPDFAEQFNLAREAVAPGTLEGIANTAKSAYDSSAQALSTIGGVGDEAARSIAGREESIRSRPSSVAWEDWQSAKGIDAVKVFLRDPVEIVSNIVASGFAGSLPSMAGGFAAGAAGSVLGPVGGVAGAVAGTGAGSLAVEYGSKYLEVLREAGADLADPESILRVVSDPKVKERAAELGLRRGIPVAAFDAISAGLAGKFIKGARTATAAQNIRRGAAEALTQGALGGAGEVAGALAAGDPISGKAVFEEVIGELGPGAAEVAGSAVRQSIGGARAESAQDGAVKRALDARRRAASIGEPPAAPAPQAPAAPREKSRGEILRGWLDADPALQDARLGALERLAARSATEEQELEVLRALVSQRAPQVARTAPSTVRSGAASEDSAPAVVVSSSKSPGAVNASAPGATAPLVTPAPVAAPAAAPVQPAAPAAPAAVGGQELVRRIRAAAGTLGSIATRVPTLDISSAQSLLDALGKAKAIGEADVAALEAELATLDAKSVTESARVAAEVSAKKSEAARAREAKKADAEAKKAAAAAARAKAAAEKAAKKLAPEPAAAPTGAIEVVATPVSPAPAVDTELRDKLSAALNAEPAKFEAGKIAQDGVISFQSLAEGLAQRNVGAMTEESRAKLRAFDFNGWLEGVVKDKSKGATKGAFFDTSGNKSRTRMAIALLMPDGRVIQAGVLPGKNVMTVGENAATVRGNALQRMGAESRKYNGDRSAATYVKTIEPGGKKPVLFEDVVKSGAIPFDAVIFDREPGEIYQEFPSREAYEATLAASERSAKSVGSASGGVVTADGENMDAVQVAEQKAAAIANQTAAPEVPVEQRLADVFGEAPEQFEKIAKRVREHGAELAFSKLPRVGREQIEELLKEANATQADLVVYLKNSVKAEPAPAAIPAPSPAPKIEAPKPTPSGEKPKSKPKKPADIEAKIDALTGELASAADDVARKEIEAEIADLYKKLQVALSKSRVDDPMGTPIQARDRFAALVSRLRSQGFNIELIEREIGQGQAGITTPDGRIVLAMEDVANANLVNIVTLIHEVGHVEVTKLGLEMRSEVRRAVDRAIADVRDGQQVKAAKNANENWEERLVETMAIRLGEEGVGEAAPSLAAAIWRAVKDIYLRAGMSMLRAVGVEPNERTVLAWFENNLRRRLGGDFDFRFIDLLRPHVETRGERSSRFIAIDGTPIPNKVDPLTGRVTQPEALPDSGDAAEWNLDRPRLTRDEGYYKGKRFSEVIATVRPEKAPAPINPKLNADTAVEFLHRFIKEKRSIVAADGRTVELAHGDSETARLLYGNNPAAITADQLLRARAVHLVKSGGMRTVARPEKLAGVGLIGTTLQKADLVIETVSTDARTPDQKNSVYAKLYITDGNPAPTWHFVRVDQAGRLISQHSAGPFGGWNTPNVEEGRIRAATGEKKDGGTSERAANDSGSRGQPLSEGTSAAAKESLSTLIGLVNPAGWSKEKLTATVMTGIEQGVVTDEEATPLLRWIEQASPDERKDAWKRGGGGLLREENIGAEQDMDYTTAMARVQAAAWGELMPAISRAKQEHGRDMNEAQFWALMSPSKDLPSAIVDRLETRVPGSARAMIDGEGMTQPMNERARYMAYRLASGLAGAARRRAARDGESIDRATDRLVEASRELTKAHREYKDANALNVLFFDSLRELVRDLALDLDRGADTAFAAGKLAGAIRQVEQLKPDAAIPAEYQEAFKRMLDADGATIFDDLSAIAKLNLPLGRMAVGDIVTAIRENAPADARLAALSKQRPLMVALATLARDQTRKMDLIQLRTLRDAAEYNAIKADLDEILSASETRLEEIAKGIVATAESKSLRDRLRSSYLDARRSFNRERRAIQRAEENKLARTRFAELMADKAAALQRGVGAFSSWVARDGATYKAMSRRDDGTWVSEDRTLSMKVDEINAQHERVARDIAMNRLYLDGEKAKAGSRLYEEVRRQTDELAKVDFAKTYQAAHRFWFDKWLQPLGQKFGGIGVPAGAKIKQMLNGWQTIMFVNADAVDARARRWNKALQEASNAAGFSNPRQFFDSVVSDVIYHIESDPGRDESGAMRVARKAAYARIPGGQNAVSADFGDKFARLLSEHKAMSELLLGIAEKNGVYISDPRMRDPLTGKGNLQRHAIKYGWLTSTRRLRSDVVRTLVNDMQRMGWSDDLFSEAKVGDVEALVGKFFPAEVVNRFLVPFVMKPGKEVFFGANDADGSPTAISQVEAQGAWIDAGGDVLKFIDGMFDRTNQLNDRKGLGSYRLAVLKRIGELYTMESRLAARSAQAKSAFSPDENRSHRLMDSRTNDLIPPEHLAYDIFTPTDARRALTEIAFHGALGRDGTAMDAAISDLEAELKQAVDRYQQIPRGTRKEMQAWAAAQGWDFAKLERAAENAKDIRQWRAKLVKHFTGSEAVVGDARALLELMQLNMTLVLNQPKSGLWNLLSLAEFPMVYRSLGKSSIRASTTAARVFARESASSFLQAFGASAIRAADYAREISEVVERRQTERLPLGTLLSDMGPDGRFVQGGAGNRVTQVARGIQTAMRKGRGEGGFNLLWAPFNFIGTKADTAIATANVQAFELMVKRAVDYFDANPEAMNKAGLRLTAGDLGMKGGWFSDEGAFNYFRERASEYGVGSIEEVARGAIARRANGERLLTRDQALAVAMMALNEVSLQASVNTRPIDMIDNPVLRFGGLMLGWPIAKVNQVNDAMKTADGRLAWSSALRALGIMAAWTLPMGLAYSMLMDEYDEELLKKRSNLRQIDPIALTPVVGPALAAASDPKNALAMLERLARAGTYGIAGDAINSLVNIVDPTSGQRDFDLNSRVLAFSQFANLRDSIRNLIHQDGEITYQSIIRPLVTTIGGGGVLQAAQLVNGWFGLSNAEAAVTNRINVGNWLRAAGREAGVELRAGGGRSSPTALSVWLQQMQTAAMTNDRVGFAEAYRAAVDVARKQGEADPEGKVLEGFKSRHPLSTVFARKPTEVEVANLYAAMNEDGQRAVKDALGLFETYAEMISPSPIVQRIKRSMGAAQRAAQPLTIDELRRRAAAF